MGEIPESVLALHANIMAQFEEAAAKKRGELGETVSLTRKSVEDALECLNLSLKRIKELEAERDKGRGQMAAMREKIEAYGRVPHWIADDALKFLEATAAGAPEAAVIKAAVFEYESCKRAGLNTCESEDGPGCAMWPICRHVDAMQKA